MKSASRAAFVLLLLPTLLAAQTKKKHSVPAAFSNARYAWVEAVSGDAYTPGLQPDDRQAIADVEDALRDWNRYALTASRHEAELVFVIRKGRLVSGRIGGTVGIGTGPLGQPTPGQRPASDPGASGPAGNGRGANAEAEAGSPDDLLQVRMLNTDGSLGAVLWERLFPEGLDAPQVALIAQLKKAVEHDYPLNPSPAKP